MAGGGYGGGYRGGGDFDFDTSDGAGGTVVEALDVLDLQMLDGYHEYIEEAFARWNNFQGNNGQLSIVANHVVEAVQEHVVQARDKWPRGAGADDYRDACYNAYDMDVMLQAFSDTIEASASAMQAIQEQSEFWQLAHDSLATLIGGITGPHSTEANWKGI